MIYNDHPEGTIPMTDRDVRQWPLSRYLHCLLSHDAMNQALTTAYSSIKRDPSDSKYQLRYNGLKLLSEVDNGEQM